jgi:hypothetical protein
MKKRRFQWLSKIQFPLKVQWDVNQRVKVTAVESAAVIGKKNDEALVWWAGKQSAAKGEANKGMLRTGIPRAFLGMAPPLYAQKVPLHASRKCGRYTI